MNEDNKIYGDDYEELMHQHLKIYTGCSVIMLIAIGLFMAFVIGVSLFMGAN